MKFGEQRFVCGVKKPLGLGVAEASAPRKSNSVKEVTAKNCNFAGFSFRMMFGFSTLG